MPNPGHENEPRYPKAGEVWKLKFQPSWNGNVEIISRVQYNPHIKEIVIYRPTICLSDFEYLMLTTDFLQQFEYYSTRNQ